MRKFNVTFEIFITSSRKEYKTITVEAGTKKIAALRAMQEINKLPGYAEKYKAVNSVMEVV